MNTRMTAREALGIAKEIAAEGEHATLTQTGSEAVAMLCHEHKRLRGAIDDAAARLDGEHMVTCARWVSVHAQCDCIIGRVRAALTKAVAA